MTSRMLTDQEGRLAALHRHGIPGMNYGDALDRIVRIATASTSSPIAAVSAVERDRQSFLAIQGLPAAPIPLDQSICAHALAGSHALIVEDLSQDQRFAHLDIVQGPPGVRSYLGVPMVSADGYVMGTVAIMDRRPRRFSDADVTILINLARLAVYHLEGRQAPNPDALTGALTRRGFQAEVEREFERSRRYGCSAALVFIDIDGFADINRRAGLDVADEVLRAVANHCAETMRSTDRFGRIGGEEFGVLLPETMAYEASQCAERIREVIAKLRFRTETEVFSVTASIGIASYVPEIKSAVQWFAQADIALYMAKNAGRNCVAFAPPVKESDRETAEQAEHATMASLNLH